METGEFSCPSPQLLRQQAAWLAPIRSRLLRRIHIARRRRVLDLACGSGAVTGELVRRGGGRVVALDRRYAALADDAEPFAGAARICADAARLPFAGSSFDLVFCQFALLWLEAAAVLGEIRRVLEPGGVLVAIEPDYGGMIEYPPEVASRDLWLAGLERAGADPLLGRKLPGLLAAAGFRYEVDLLDRLVPPSAARFDLLRGLPLTSQEQALLAKVEAVEAAGTAAGCVVHLPMFLLTAMR